MAQVKRTRKAVRGGGAKLRPPFDAKLFLTTIGGGRTITAYKPKDTVFRQGDACDAVYYIEAGKVQLRVVSKQGKEGMIAMLGPGDFIGEGCLTGQPLRLASAVAMTEARVARIDKETMTRVLQEQPKLSAMFVAFLLSRNLAIEADLVDQLFNSSEQRLARILLLLANFGKDRPLDPIIPAVNQDILAARVGTTRSRINFFLNKFRKLGLIEYNGEFRVHPSLLNVILHE